MVGKYSGYLYLEGGGETLLSKLKLLQVNANQRSWKQITVIGDENV